MSMSMTTLARRFEKIVYLKTIMHYAINWKNLHCAGVWTNHRWEPFHSIKPIERSKALNTFSAGKWKWIKNIPKQNIIRCKWFDHLKYFIFLFLHLFLLWYVEANRQGGGQEWQTGRRLEIVQTSNIHLLQYLSRYLPLTISPAISTFCNIFHNIAIPLAPLTILFNKHILTSSNISQYIQSWTICKAWAVFHVAKK